MPCGPLRWIGVDISISIYGGLPGGGYLFFAGAIAHSYDLGATVESMYQCRPMKCSILLKSVGIFSL